MAYREIADDRPQGKLQAPPLLPAEDGLDYGLLGDNGMWFLVLAIYAVLVFSVLLAMS